MARTCTVAQMLVDLANVTEEPTFASNTYVTQTEAIRYLSQSAHAFSQLTLAQDLLSKTDTFSAVSGTQTYALPSDFAMLVNMYFPVQGQPNKLCRADVDSIDQCSTSYGGWVQGRALYCILGENIYVTDPKAAYTVTRRYVPELPMFNTGGTAIADFGATTDYVQCKGGVERWLVLDAAIKIYQKQRTDPAILMAMRGDVEAGLKPNILDRDAHENPHVRNSWDRPIYGDGREGPW
jgi:hypothetical protein